MIEIDIEDKSKEEVKFGGTIYRVDFSDEKQKKYVDAYEKVMKRINDIGAEYDKMQENAKATGEMLADKAIEMIELQRNESIKFLDLIFGTGEGAKIYSKCGESTEYLSQKVEELATAIAMKRDSDHRQELQSIKDKYIHRRRNKR